MFMALSGLVMLLLIEGVDEAVYDFRRWRRVGE